MCTAKNFLDLEFFLSSSIWPIYSSLHIIMQNTEECYQRGLQYIILLLKIVKWNLPGFLESLFTFWLLCYKNLNIAYSFKGYKNDDCLEKHWYTDRLFYSVVM
jgi:hypothetical protein